MKKLKKFMFSPKGTLIAFGAAMVLLLLSSIGGARAAVEYSNSVHNTQIETQHIGVTLQEKIGEDSWNTIASGQSWTNTGENKYDQTNSQSLRLPAIAAEGEGRGAKVGVPYSEELQVVNSGEIDQYVRVTVYKWWLKDGVKQTDLYPSYIELGYAPGWKVDTNATTQERTVLYYTGNDDSLDALASGAPVPVVNSITINPAVSGLDENGTYPYEGCSFKVEVQVDAVQTHSAEDAILSAWGKTLNSDGSLSGLE